MKKIKNIIDYVLVILLFILSFQKGGFYKTDILLFSVGVGSISFIYIVLNIINDIKNKNYKVDLLGIVLLALPFAYMLPILLNNYSDLNDSIFEMIRYFNLYFIYKLVKASDNKKVFINTIIILTVIQCILSIDAVSCRLLNKALQKIGSGYLDTDIIRMSGTIQYANVLAMLCFISVIFVNEKLNIEKKINYTLKCTIMFILISTLILTGSRSVIILMLLYYIIFFIQNNSKINQLVITYILLVCMVGIYTSTIYSNMMIDSTKIYFIFLIFTCITMLIYYVSSLVFNIYIKNKLSKNVKLTSIVLFTILLFSVIYIIVALNYTSSLKLSESGTQKNDVLILKNIKYEKNNIRLKVDTNKVDTRYNISLNSVDINGIESNIKNFNYYDNTSGFFEYDFNLDNNIKYLKLYIKCEKGSITLNNTFLNDKKQKLNYVLIPRNIIYRIDDLFSGSTSVTDRLMYYKDACKIIIKSPLNFIVGVGGEGFNNLYEQVKTTDYHSSEVHNSFLQIFVESGIIGFTLIMFAIVYSILKSKKGYIKIAYIFLIIHSIIDLDFSYMLIIAVFGVLLGTLEIKDNSVDNKVLYILNAMLSILCILLFSYIIIRASVAFYMLVPSYDENSLNLEKQIEVVNKNEIRVELDPYEYSYRKSLDTEYEIYLSLLNKSLEKSVNEKNIEIIQKEIINVLNNVEKNAQMIQKNNSTNKNQILYVCSIYFKNIDRLSKLNYSGNLKEGYFYYFDIITKDIDYLRYKYKLNDKELEILNNTKKDYKNKFDIKVLEI